MAPDLLDGWTIKVEVPRSKVKFWRILDFFRRRL